MDSGYPTSEVVKTASPVMFLLAPKAVPWNTGPFWSSKLALSMLSPHGELTLIVKVAGTCATGSVGVGVVGIFLPLLPVGVAA